MKLNMICIKFHKKVKKTLKKPKVWTFQLFRLFIFQPTAHGRESNSQPVDHKSDDLTNLWSHVTRSPLLQRHGARRIELTFSGNNAQAIYTVYTFFGKNTYCIKLQPILNLIVLFSPVFAPPTKTRCHAIAGTTARCRCKFRYVYIEFYNGIVRFFSHCMAFLCTSVTTQMLKLHTVR